MTFLLRFGVYAKTKRGMPDTNTQGHMDTYAYTLIRTRIHNHVHIHTQTCTYAHKTQTCKYIYCNCMHMCQQSVMHYLADGISPLNLIDHTNT